MTRRIMTGALALSLAAVLGGATPAPATGGEFTTKVRIVDYAFRAKRIEIGQGTKVRWVNKGSETHTVSSGNSFDSGNIAPGDTFTKRFKQTGVFKYQCQIHDEMRGRVTVGDV